MTTSGVLEALPRSIEKKENRDVQFRLTRVSDIDRIMDILHEGRVRLAMLGIDQWQGGYPHRAVIEADVARGDSYVAVDESYGIIGTLMVGFSGERDYDVIDGAGWLSSSLSPEPRYGVVHRVAVSRVAQGHGVAGELLSHAECIVRECGRESIRIDTHPGNMPMRHILIKRGYQECGTIYISHAEGATPDRIAYEKIL